MGRRTPEEIANDIRLQESALARTTEFGSGGTDPAYVPDREVFDSYAHQQIWDLVHQKLDPSAMGQVASSWNKVQDKINQAFDTFAKEVKREFAEWSGEFASEAQKSTDAFITAGGDTHQTAYDVQRLMDLNASAASVVKAAIPPPPVAYKPDPDPAKEAANGAARTAHNTQAAALAADARDAMHNIYNPTMVASGDAVGRFTPAPAPSIQPAPTLATAAAADTSKPAPAKQDPGTDTSAKDNKPTDDKPGDQTRNGNQQQPDNTADQAQPNSTQTAASSATSPASTPAAQQSSATPVTTNTPSQTTATPMASGTSPSTPGITSIGPGVSNTTQPQQPGRALPPAPGTSRPGEQVPGTTTETARTAQTPATTSRSPASAMPHAASAGHGRKESENERTRTSPEYLRRTYEELSDLPAGMVEVIGVGGDPDDESQYAVEEAEPDAEVAAEEPTIYVGKGPMDNLGPQDPAPENADHETAPASVTQPIIHVGKGPMDEPNPAEPKDEGPEGTSS
ncbi:hypothetical protein [Nocardia macrotermitis]|uniref:PPE family domain-containing protein n=1 Tax=Nocardia macrotermitis TaxID=2585198 RepID=A0A7K0DF71_9NOCA|nr:hypothetical protein [Nocardia macrotermitis]MQY24347.1 hypothetical protein [Nocardia macrotermitis]